MDKWGAPAGTSTEDQKLRLGFLSMDPFKNGPGGPQWTRPIRSREGLKIKISYPRGLKIQWPVEYRPKDNGIGSTYKGRRSEGHTCLIDGTPPRWPIDPNMFLHALIADEHVLVL